MASQHRSTRVAAVQLAAGTSLDENLDTCVRAIAAAAAHEPDLIVLPEFCNHLSWYEDPAHCYQVAVDLEGSFVAELAAAARAAGAYVVVNCTVRRSNQRVTGTSLLLDRRGALAAQSDKQVLIGHENDFLCRADAPGPVVPTPIGRLAMYACMDGVINETPRCLALRGAQILCNSLNSFALDEASLHVPVRAAENRVFVVAANKVGPLIPEALLEPVSAATGIPTAFLYGAGESQIIAPDGTVLAKAPREGAAVVVAELQPQRADDKRRPDGTDVFAARRPSLYGPITADPQTQPPPISVGTRAAEVAVAAPDPAAPDPLAAAVAQVEAAGRDGARLVVLPELFYCAGARADDPQREEDRAVEVIAALSDACPDGCRIVTSVVARDSGTLRHMGVVIGPAGVVAHQPQRHRAARHAWATPGDEQAVVDLQWCRLGVVVGDDALYPETFRLLALQGVELVAVPCHPLESWELDVGLLERAAENRLCLAASAPNAGLITTLHEDFTLMSPWKSRAFDGLLSCPLVTRSAGARVTSATVHPRNAANKVVSHRTDLLRSRPWFLAEPIARISTPKEVRHA